MVVILCRLRRSHYGCRSTHRLVVRFGRSGNSPGLWQNGWISDGAASSASRPGRKTGSVETSRSGAGKEKHCIQRRNEDFSGRYSIGESNSRPTNASTDPPGTPCSTSIEPGLPPRPLIPSTIPHGETRPPSWRPLPRRREACGFRRKRNPNHKFRAFHPSLRSRAGTSPSVIAGSLSMLNSPRSSASGCEGLLTRTPATASRLSFPQS